MRQLFSFLLIVFVLLAWGCGTGLQSRWNNFNAYYNTFYNAKQSYHTGLQKNLDQGRDYNPLQPIRIHAQPVNAGSQDFNKAIEKSADVLRKYDESKWVDDALALIGKSYYFRGEYFSADQKFKELYTTTGNQKMKQESVIWQGRVLLDMEFYTQGIAFLNEQLTDFEGQWTRKNKAEVNALLAQHYVMQENWDLAREHLVQALPHLPEKGYKERGYFLLGQIYERLDDIESAYQAYDKVQDHYTEYRVQYLAKRKKAEVARDLERNDVAYSLFKEMLRDDKNTEYQADLDYELARTEQMRGNYEEAERIYKNLLHSRLRQPEPVTKAKAYYGLAEIYRFQDNNFRMAAVYYDSAAQVNVPRERLPEGYQANELAESFGEYTRIKSEIALQDSLLNLGMMSDEEFDSAMVELRKKKLKELEELRKQQEARQNRMVNVGGGNRRANQQNQSTSRNGFLNIRNKVMVQDAKQQFRAIWGDRPLVDNWRVSSLIESSAANNESQGENPENLSEEAGGRQSQVDLNIDISNVPFTPGAQDSVRQLISGYQYELGNLFFLSLNMPDSAVTYYQKALQNPARPEINAVALYSLSELESIEGNESQAEQFARRLIEEYPKTEYANRLSDKFDLTINIQADTTNVDTLWVYQLIMEQDTLDPVDKADQLVNFSKAYSESGVAPRAMYSGIQLYMQKGKQDSTYETKINNWTRVNRIWEAQQDSFKVAKDSAQVMLKDTTVTLSDTVRAQYESLKDSTLTEPDFKEYFPYRGAYWDSARTTIDEFLDLFESSNFTPKVQSLKEEIAIPKEPEPEESQEVTPALQDSISTAQDSIATSQDSIATVQDSVAAETREPTAETREGFTNCSEINAEVTIRGGMNRFLNRVEFPEEISLPEITYRFFINQRGLVSDYNLVTEEVPEGIQSAFKTAIDDGLSFEPTLYEGQAVPVQCDVSFTLSGSSQSEDEKE